MCGIFSLFFSPYVNNKKRYDIFLDEAMKMLQKRGPDSSTKVVTDDYLAGFVRLSINDLSENGNQPMFSENKNIFLMCNGEIFNYLQLKDKYNLDLKSKSDCEVILRLYETNQLKLEELNGDFAFVIFDSNKRLITMARDRIGVRPLFYGFTRDHSLVVGSEAKALSICDIDRVFHVQPANVVTYTMDGEHIDKTPYYDITKMNSFTCEKNDIKTLLIDSTRKRLLTDRPIGCLLSGGLDSSIICAILCSLIGPKNVRTYSIGMEGSLDLYYAQKVADYLGTDHHEVLFTPKEGIDAIPEVVYHLESFDITTVRASVGMYLLGKYISKNTDDKVIFSGEGSDELFCGYLYFHYAPSAQEAQEESLRLISEMYKYDALRADRCISSHGLELRVPFLDPSVIEYAKTLAPEKKMPNGGIEKKILRDAFRGMLPDDVLFRRKDGFSDGVSGKTKPWYEYIREHVGDSTEKEMIWYRQLYEKDYSHFTKPIDYFWMPKWVDCKGNPSGRVLRVFDEQ
jgi:asparagine synthase (glutamine-hydrolysing)